MIVPAIGNKGENPLVTVAYFLLLLWTFMGVAIVAQVFMDAIEKVTSKKKTYKTEDGYSRTANVWNPTVANLTLMALGSSAPEILLNVVGIFPNYVSGPLGPSTIVGSAAFNLLVIIAVCVVAIPNGGVRRIANLGVYSVTATSSLFAYVWLLIIVLYSSKDVVEAWEGALTFLFFWILVAVAYYMDIRSPPQLELKDGQSEDLVWQMELAVRKKYGAKRLLTVEETATLMHYEFPEKYSRAVHRSQAVGFLTGGKKPLPANSRVAAGEALAKALLSSDGPEIEMGNVISKSPSGNTKLPKVRFDQKVYTVTEVTGEFSIIVKLQGEMSQMVKVPWTTVSGTAKAGDDFEEKSGVLEFTPGGVTEQAITLTVKTSEEEEKNEEFYVQLLEADKTGNKLAGCRLGAIPQCTVCIIDVGKVTEDAAGFGTEGDGKAGSLRFDREEVPIICKKTDVIHIVTVKRVGGNYGQIQCSYSTEADTAIEEKDFDALSGTLVFQHLEEEKTFTVNIKGNTDAFEADENFRIVLSDVKGGATFDDKTDGGSDSCIQTITILGTNTGGIQAFLGPNWDRVELGASNWKDQILNSLKVRGGEEDEDDAPPGIFDYVMHIVSVFWKFLFALIPPTEFAEGWLTFVVALGFIGVVTVVIGDLAELLGCALEIEDSITAITLVALGTSLPDTFASRTAAMWEPTADSSIGNVTGSNSVNVFLGLGLPWGICSLYWWSSTCEPNDEWSILYGPGSTQGDISSTWKEGVFVVYAGDLAKSVVVFVICGSLCIMTLALRRVTVGGELGGPPNVAYASAAFFVFLWLVYIGYSIYTVQQTKSSSMRAFA